jgi:hypothetical protein
LEQTSALSGQPIQITLSGGAQSPQFAVDAGRGTITINNFVSPVNPAQSMSASQSFVVRATLAGGTGESSFLFRPTPPVLAPSASSFQTTPTTAVPLETDERVRGDYSPLMWYYVLPGTPMNSPTLSGDYLYYPAQVRGRAMLIALDANPQNNDPAVGKGSRQVLNVVSAFVLNGSAQPPRSINHARWKQTLEGLPDANGAKQPVTRIGSAVGGQGVLAVNTDQGLFAFEETLTLIGEQNRVVEAKPDGSASWVLNNTVRVSTAGGEVPRFVGTPPDVVLDNPNEATGRRVLDRTPISRPSVVRRLTASEMLIADTGNNRVVRVDRSGRELWELEALNDPFNIRASGDPATLSGPTDVDYWPVTRVDANGNVTGYEAHYLIADAGNYRIIEVVDFYDTRAGSSRTCPAGAAGAKRCWFGARARARKRAGSCATRAWPGSWARGSLTAKR